MSTKRSFCQRKTEGGQEKGLANLWSRKKITKKAHAGRGQEAKWEMSIEDCPGVSKDQRRNMKNRPFQLGAVLQFLWICHASAAVLYVNVNSANLVLPYSSWGTAATTIQAAVDASTNGDQILVTNGTYSSGGRAVYGATTNRVAVDRPVVVQSVNGPQVTIIQGVTSPPSAVVRGVYLTNGAELIGFTVKKGSSRNTGDWFNEQCGGGVFCQSTSAVVSNCTLTLNYAFGNGGGVVSGTLFNCTLSANTAGAGGGSESANLNNCVLNGNSATSGGGACYGALSNCTVSGNTAKDPSGKRIGEGGGAYSCSAINCILTGNSARVDGGGASWGSLVNCLVANNTALQGGGASAVNLVNCTVVGNSAPTDGQVGGGLGGGVLGCSVSNSIIISNTATFGGGDNDDSTLSWCCTPSYSGVLGNITNVPAFVNQAGGDYRLQSNSPCINAGNNSCVTNGTDLDGNPRIVGGTVDIGAYEFQSPRSIISYAWLQQYGLPMDGSADYADTDGDGMNTWQEWMAGTDPTCPSSVLRILALSNTVAGTTVLWQSVSTRNYCLQRSTNLAGRPVFSTIQSNIAGQDGTTSCTDATATNGGPYFYRAGVQ